VLSGAAFPVGNRVLAPQTLPVRGEWFVRKGLLIIGPNVAGVVSRCSAMQHTSAANALSLLAFPPFLAAILSCVLPKKRMDRATALAIALVIACMLILGSGCLGRGRLPGDGFALMNALNITAGYIKLRTTVQRPELGLITAHIAWDNLVDAQAVVGVGVARDVAALAMLAANPGLVRIDRAERFASAQLAWQTADPDPGLGAAALRPGWLMGDLNPRCEIGIATAALAEMGKAQLAPPARTLDWPAGEFAPVRPGHGGSANQHRLAAQPAGQPRPLCQLFR
jgi:hypothetical protein